MNRLGLITLTVIAGASVAQAEIQFSKHIIDPVFQAEAVTTGDINGDGKVDIVCGENWYEGPAWQPHRFRTVEKDGLYANLRCDYAQDVNGDGRTDVLTIQRTAPLLWFENPGDDRESWTAHEIGKCPETESAIFADIDADGKIDIVCTHRPKGRSIAWLKAGEDPAAPWTVTQIREDGGGPHGLGVGDMNRDGRLDVLGPYCWYEAPADPTQPDWKEYPLHRSYAHQTAVFDFDGDGDVDVASGSPHDYGTYWWEQLPRPGKKSAWCRHTIDDTISQLHALVGTDLDGDGDMDIVTGKRYHAHGGKDPGAEEPALLVWYELSRSNGKAEFVRRTIDNDSGVGYFILPIDLDGDGDMDILTATRKGLIFFEQIGQPRLANLFNGRDLSNWTGNRTVWSVKDGTIVGKTTTKTDEHSFLVSQEEYDNFILTVDVKLVPDSANSGIQFRSKPLEGQEEVEGYQADIAKGWWGSIYEEHGRGPLHKGYEDRGKKAVVPEGWNHYVVYAVGQRLRLEINGTVCSDITDDQRKTGIIALQVHSGPPTEVRFRNLRLRRVEP